MQEIENLNLIQDINEEDPQSYGAKFWDDNCVSSLERKHYYQNSS